MKIVYCIEGTSNSGGMERVLSNKANYWVAHGHEVTVVTTDQMGKPRFFYYDPRIKFYDLGINYTDNNGKSVWNKIFDFPKKQYKNKKRLSKLLKKLKADIVVSMFNNDATFVPSIRDGSRKVVEIHFSKFWRLQRDRTGLWRLIDRFRTYMDARIVRRFDRFVVLTHEDKEHWGKMDNIEVIPNALTFQPDRPSPVTTRRVLAVGRFAHQKNFADLLDIWAEVSPHHPGWVLTIVGEGPLRKELEQQIRALSLGDSVTIEASTREMERWYLDSSIVAMTSRYEGLPMVLLEAQAFGLPIISYTCKCGPRDIVTPGKDGVLIGEGDKAAFAEALSQMMRDQMRLQEMGREAFLSSKRFTEEKVMARWTTLFEDLLREQR